MLKPTRPVLLRYSIAVLAVGVALLLKLLLEPLITQESPFLLFFAAVMISAWFGGLGPGLGATALAALASDYFFLTPVYSVLGQSLSQNLRLGLFVLEGMLVSSIIAALHTARGRAEISALTAYRHQENLLQSEARFRSLVQNSSDIIMILKPDGTIGYDSPSVERILGYQPEALVGKNALAYVHPEDVSVVQATLTNIVQRSGSVVPVEYRFRHLNGSWVHLDSVGNNCLDDQSVQGIVINSRDISVAKRREAERQRAESAARFLAEASTVLTASLDYETTLANVAHLAVPRMADWCVVDIAAADRVRRLAVAHLDPAKVELIWELNRRYPEDPSGPEGIPKVLRTGQPELYPEIPDALLVAVAQDHEHLKILRELGFKSAIVLPLIARGRTLGALTFVTAESRRCYSRADLSLAEDLAYKAAFAMDNALLYREAQESEARFRRVVESNIIGIIFWDASGNITEANDAFLEMVGYTRSELLLGKLRWNDMTPAEYQTLDQKALAELAATGACTPFEKEYIRKDGSRVAILLGSALLEGSQDQGVCFVLDIRARKRAEQALRSRAAELARLTRTLEKRNRELDQFAYVTSHDLKAPLRAIANLSQWIEEDLGDALTEETQRQMNLLRGRVHRMEALINGILQYSRAGRVEAKPETLGVEQLLAEVIDSLAPPPEFTIKVEPGMPTLLTERVPLEQVFANLIGNALKHHHRRNGTVAIAAKDQGEFYEFAVADDGPGILPQYHEKVFTIFQTLEARDKVESTGIGLALVKKIVESKGGSIRLDSQAGRGTTFYFDWPKHLSAQR